MEIKINDVHFDASERLKTFANSRVSKLTQYSDDIISAEVTLKFEKAEQVENKVAKIKLDIPGLDLFAEKQAKSFEEAIDLTLDALRRQLEKRKGKTKEA